MRKLIWMVDMSLDGYMSGPNGELEWMAGSMDAEMWEYVNELLSTVDTVLFGRATYQDFERYWPAAGRNPKTSKNELDFSQWIDRMPKFVGSTTVKKVEWENSSLLNSDVAEGVSSIKRQPGKNILMFGSCNFAATLLEGGLIDEMRMRIHPVILGAGRPLFHEGRARRKLKLVESRAFQTGVVGLRYEVALAKIIGDNS